MKNLLKGLWTYIMDEKGGIYGMAGLALILVSFIPGLVWLRGVGCLFILLYGMGIIIADVVVAEIRKLSK